MATDRVDKNQPPAESAAQAAQKQKEAAIKGKAFGAVMQEAKFSTGAAKQDEVEYTFKAAEQTSQKEDEGGGTKVDFDVKSEKDEDVKDSKEDDKGKAKPKGGVVAQKVMTKKHIELKGGRQKGGEVKLKTIDEQVKEMVKASEPLKTEKPKQVTPAEVAGRPDMTKLIQSKEFLELMVANIRTVVDTKEERRIFQIDMRKDVLKGLKMNVIMDKEGLISTEFISDSPEVRSALNSNIEDLRKQLTARGLKVKDMNIAAV